jgi:hypothetical protein
VQRFDRDRRRLFDAQQKFAARFRAQLRRQPRTQSDFTFAQSAPRGVHPLKLPEALVNAIDLHVPAAPPARLIDHDAFKHHQRARPCERRTRKLRMRAQLCDQIFAEEIRRRDDVSRLPQTLQHERAQTRAHRIPDEQRARQHRHGNRHAAHHRHIRAPVVDQIASEQRDDGHKKLLAISC